MADHVRVHPRPGVTIFTGGGVHGFRDRPAPIPAEHAALLARHVQTDAEREGGAIDPGADAGRPIRRDRAGESPAAG